MYSPLYEKALRFSLEQHSDQRRKGGMIPYVTHVIHVAHILTRHGLPEEIVAAALLHDILEDTPVELDELEREFGPEVAAAVSDVTEPPKTLHWRERKEGTVASLRNVPPLSKALKAADLLHNLSSIREDLKEGQEVWSRFNAGRESQIWYYTSALDALAEDWDHPMIEEGRQVLAEIEALD